MRLSCHDLTILYQKVIFNSEVSDLVNFQLWFVFVIITENAYFLQLSISIYSVNKHDTITVSLEFLEATNFG